MNPAAASLSAWSAASEKGAPSRRIQDSPCLRCASLPVGIGNCSSGRLQLKQFVCRWSTSQVGSLLWHVRDDLAQLPNDPLVLRMPLTKRAAYLA